VLNIAEKDLTRFIDNTYSLLKISSYHVASIVIVINISSGEYAFVSPQNSYTFLKDLSLLKISGYHIERY